MSVLPPRLVLDANVFIQAKRRYYALDFCPGYWNSLCWHRGQGNLCSIKSIERELAAGGDDLATWIESQFGSDSFEDVSGSETIEAYAKLLAWVMTQPQFTDAAKNEFQAVADGWLVAYALATGGTVVTLEEHNSESKKRVPIPNICRAFGIEYINPFEMIRRLRVTLSWAPPKESGTG